MLTWGSSRHCPVKGWDVIFIEQAQGLQGGRFKGPLVSLGG